MLFFSYLQNYAPTCSTWYWVLNFLQVFIFPHLFSPVIPKIHADLCRSSKILNHWNLCSKYQSYHQIYKLSHMSLLNSKCNYTNLEIQSHTSWAIPTLVHLDSSIWPGILLPILWKIWEARNAAAFRTENHSPRVTITSLCRDFDLWTLRFREPSDKVAALSWRYDLSSRIAVTL